MSLIELSNKYMRLREDLARAYGESVWNSQHIDTLTDEIADTEFALSAASGAECFFDAARLPVQRGTGPTVVHL